MVPIQGHVSPGFEAVREVFAENFDQRRELGGACYVLSTAKKSSTSGAVSEERAGVSEAHVGIRCTLRRPAQGIWAQGVGSVSKLCGK